MRSALLLLLVTACDPSDQIRVRFPAPAATASGMVHLYWVQTFNHHRSAGMTGAPRPLVEGFFDQTYTTCCGTAVAYRTGDLGYLACVDRPGGPELVCGMLGSAATPPVRAAATVGSCAEVDASLADVSVDLARCALDPLPPR